MFSSKWPKNLTFCSLNQLKMKKESKQTIRLKSASNKYTNDHIQADGNICIDHWEKQGESGCSVFFTANKCEPRTVEGWRGTGVGMLNSDLTFEFIRKSKPRSESTLIKKLPHGRLSATKDGFIQLTLKFRVEDDEDIASAICEEALISAQEIRSY